ncbi:MAG TPA: TlpA disulfide reductase family protein [Gemmatimonadaceae bacterium]|jgi:cytochrome c-type biogenesis protein
MRNRNAVAVAVALLAISACKKLPPSNASGAPAPAFTAQDLDGKPVALADLKGKVVVLNEWATWCEPCRGEIPQLEAVYREYAPQGLVMIGVSVDAFGTGGDVRDFAKEHEMTYSIWLDPDKHFAAQFTTVGVPETFVIDRAGRIRRRFIGALQDGDTSLTATLKSALAEH